MKKAMDKSTKDSIEALEALLKIRECNEQQQASSSCATTPTVNTSASSTISPSNESMRAGGISLVAMNQQIQQQQQRNTSTSTRSALNAIHHPQPTPTAASAAASAVSTPGTTSNISGNGNVSFPYLLNALQAKRNPSAAVGAATAVTNPHTHPQQQPNPLQASHSNPNRSVNFQLPYPSSLTPQQQQQLQQQLQHQQQHQHAQHHTHTHSQQQQLANTAANLALFATQNQQQAQNLPMSLVNFDPRIAQTLQQQQQHHQQQQQQLQQHPQQQQLLHPSISPTLKDIVQPQATATVPTTTTGTILSTRRGRTLTPIAMSPQPPGTMSLATTNSTSAAAAAAITNLELNKEVIRKEEIEAALKSKPQRGRKRENLSGLERQELTRTRNREHAKTTRIRKKARYEELVACEKKYLELKERRDFEEARKNVILQFMSIRSKVAEPLKKICNDTNSWNFSFENESSCKTDENNLQVLAGLYEDIVLDCATFSVDIFSGLSRITAANLCSLQTHDCQIIGIVKSKTAEESNVSFQFKIKGDKNGIGLNTNNDGFAQCEFSVSLDAKEGKQVRVILKTDIVHVKFAKDSTMITSMKIFNIADGTASFSPAKLHDAQFAQASFPSVVSLEQSCSVTSEKTL